jgi:hypothetical protein
VAPVKASAEFSARAEEVPAMVEFVAGEADRAGVG